MAACSSIQPLGEDRIEHGNCSTRHYWQLLKKSPRLVITLPVFKDSEFLECALKELDNATRSIVNDYIFVIAEDGSDSSKMISELKTKYPNVVHLQSGERLGKGRALRESWGKVDGDIYLFADVDLATDLNKLDAYRNLIESQKEYDLVTGSRYLPESTCERPPLRKLASLAYNSLVRLLFRTGVRDHQCGFKSLSKRLVERLLVESRSDSWFWDTEAFVLARKFGFRIHEIPVYWVEVQAHRTSLKRLMSDGLLFGSGLLKLLKRTYFTLGT